MDRYQLHIRPGTCVAGTSSSACAEQKAAPARLTFDVPNMQTALVVTEINMPIGTAEVWCGGKRIASLRRQRVNQPTYWEVGGNRPDQPGD